MGETAWYVHCFLLFFGLVVAHLGIADLIDGIFPGIFVTSILQTFNQLFHCLFFFVYCRSIAVIAFAALYRSNGHNVGEQLIAFVYG